MKLEYFIACVDAQYLFVYHNVVIYLGNLNIAQTNNCVNNRNNVFIITPLQILRTVAGWYCIDANLEHHTVSFK